MNIALGKIVYSQKSISYKIFSQVFVLPILLTNLHGTEIFKPSEGEILNYTQILFTWPQIPNSSYYQLTIDSIEDTTYSVFDTTNSIVYSEGFEWGNSYSWQVCGFHSGDTIYCHNSLEFSILSISEVFTHEIEIEIFTEEDIFLKMALQLLIQGTLDIHML